MIMAPYKALVGERCHSRIFGPAELSGGITSGIEAASRREGRHRRNDAGNLLEALAAMTSTGA